MDLPVNTFKRKLLAGEQQIGLWISLASPYSTEIVAGAGFDWGVLDTEHSPNEVTDILPQLLAVSAYAMSPVVRIAWNDKVLMKRHLDQGAQTILVPYVSNSAEALAAVASMRYPTRGVRGVAGVTRASRFGRVKDYAKRAEEELCLLVQVETREAMDNVESIAKMDGVHGVFIGPADLAAALGHLGNPGHPEVQETIRRTIERIRTCKKAAGILATDEVSARRYISWGSTFTAVGLDAMVLARELEKLASVYVKVVQPEQAQPDHRLEQNARILALGRVVEAQKKLIRVLLKESE
jgi:4-hydroxy-2-oxoheptanedioate aldolase